MAAKSFYIIDGHAQIFRAYFAPFRDLTGPNGEPTKATYVFTQMLFNLIEQRKPDYLAMVIDGADVGEEEAPVFRQSIYPEYKSNRKAPPDDFHPQEERILRIVRDAGLPIFAKAGFEADDLIATMAKRLCDKGFETFMVSKDKDLRQVVNDCTKMYDPQADEVWDAKKLEDKLGYGPTEAVEVQTLVGDAIDNIPGIPGVGEKTAAKLIKKYGTADEVLRHLDELTPKMRENFQTHGDRLPLARKLVTLRDDLDMEFDPDTCKFVGLNPDGLRPHLTELNFQNLLKRLPSDAPVHQTPLGLPPISKKSPSPSQQKQQKFDEHLFAGAGEPAPKPAEELEPGVATGADCKYELVQTPEQFEAFLAELKQQKRFAFDTETDSLSAIGSKLVGMSFSWEHGKGFYVPICGPAESLLLPCDTVIAALKPILCDEGIKKVGHNIKYDLLVMRENGLEMRGVELDSMMAAFLLDSTRMQYGIDRLAMDLLKFRKVPTVDLLGKGKHQITMDQVELQKIACYASEDADIALRLCDLLGGKLDEYPDLRKLAHDVEIPLIDVLVEMEHNGVGIDPAVLKEQSDVLAGRVEELYHRIQKEAGFEFNPDSPKQLGELLYTKLGLKVVKRTKTGPSTDVEALEKLADKHPVPKLILEYRSLVKLKNTYLDNLTDYVNKKTGRIHGSFNQTGASTGRLSMSDPNLQNIPIRTDEGRRIRLAFVPGDPVNNVLLTADYSQIELRVLTHFTQEPALLKAFEADEDIHRAVASEVFATPLEEVTREQRNYAKTINFGIIYGVSAYGLSRRIEGLTTKAAAELIASYHRRFPRIQEFLMQCVKHAQDHGHVQTILGRRRPITDINSAIISVRNQSERMAINSVVQGSAADLIKIAMLNVYRRLKDPRHKHPSKLLLQVHDELVFETPEHAAESEAKMVREEMIRAGTQLGLKVPLKVEVGWAKNWQEVK
jgi:DNA polymerase-1